MILRVLMTGAAGRVAQWVLPHLSSAYEWVLADRRAGEVNGRRIQALDITDYEAVLSALRGVDAVVHLAIASGREFVTDPARFAADEGDEYLRFNEASVDVNLRGTYHVFEAARAAGLKRIVFGSSLTVLQGAPVYAQFHDGLPPRPTNFYAVTKLWGEQLGELFSRKHGMTVYCLRFGNPYPKPNAPKPSEWKRPLAQRCSVSFRDLASSIDCALTAPSGPVFGAYSIVSTCAGSIYDCSGASEIGWRSRSRCEADGSVTPID